MAGDRLFPFLFHPFHIDLLFDLLVGYGAGIDEVLYIEGDELSLNRNDLGELPFGRLGQQEKKLLVDPVGADGLGLTGHTRDLGHRVFDRFGECAPLGCRVLDHLDRFGDRKFVDMELVVLFERLVAGGLDLRTQNALVELLLKQLLFDLFFVLFPVDAPLGHDGAQFQRIDTVFLGDLFDLVVDVELVHLDAQTLELLVLELLFDHVLDRFLLGQTQPLLGLVDLVEGDGLVVDDDADGVHQSRMGGSEGEKEGEKGCPKFRNHDGHGLVKEIVVDILSKRFCLWYNTRNFISR